MRFESLERLSFIVFLAIILVILLIVGNIFSEFGTLNEKQNTLDSLIKNSSEVSSHIHTYVNTPDNSQLESIIEEIIILQNSLNKLNSTNPEVTHELYHIDTELTSLRIASEGLLHRNQHPRFSEWKYINEQFRVIKPIGETIVLQSEKIKDDILFINNLIEIDTKNFIYNALTETLILILFLIIYIFAKYLLVSRKLLNSLLYIKDGIETIDQDNLDYKIEITNENEIRDISNTVKALSDNLKSVLISKDLLEKQLQIKKKTELELINKNYQLTETFEELSAASQEIQASFQELADKQKDLEESEERYRTLFERMLSGFALCQLIYNEDKVPSNFKYLTVNSSFKKMIGYNYLEGKYATDFIPNILTEKSDLLVYADEAIKTGEPRFTDFYYPYTNKWFHVRFYPKGMDEFIGLVEDTTEIMNFQRERDRINAEVTDIYNNAPCGYYSIDSDGIIVQMNEMLLKWLKYKPDEVIGIKSILDILSPKCIESYNKAFANLKEEGESKDLSFFFERKDGTTFPVRLNSTTIVDDKGVFLKSRSTVLDNTEKEEYDANMRKSLAEKEILLKEIHHRVKNNLQVVSSLLYMQARTTDDINIKRILTESQGRVKSIALIHEKLYQSKDLSHINFKEYIIIIADYLLQTYQLKNGKISINFDIEDIYMHIDKVVPTSLMITEMLTNSFKYAFNEQDSGTINISCHENDGKCTIIYLDDGIGLPAGLDLKNRKNSLGLLLIEGLTKQLNGNAEIIKLENMTGYQIIFDI